ncbi:hypothetical protein DRM42_10760 [Salmonella enterica subsp. enterica]|nr:hypothetical protein [Salmonella enterica subsp. enterica serovar Mikawasima]MMF32698.1 hypothetical protein [Salmonella enterica subsp. enterica serovar Bonn]
MLDSLPDAALPFWAYKSRCLFGPTKADASLGLQKQMPQDRPSASRSVCSRQARRARSVLNVREEHEHFPGTK